MTERRGASRVSGPFEARWSGASGGGHCRIVDISTTGCFVNHIGEQFLGSEVAVTVLSSERPFTLPGTVVAVEHGIGFGVRFHPLADELRDALAEWLTRPENPK